MRLLFYLITCCLLACLPLLGEHGRDSEPAQPRREINAPQSGIKTDDSYSVEGLVQDVFVAGACNTISNIRAIGNPKGIGYFENGRASIGIERGVILATGPVGNAEGPNESTDKSGDFADHAGDPDLDILATGEVKDAVGIEFDFMPLDSIVTFHYVFASEEYCEFVGSVYNDVFGFFIQGPGINGHFSNNASNVALIPGTQDYVSINSVNYQQNASYYVRNELNEDALHCGLDFYYGSNYEEIEYDGFTRELTAVLQLQPCQTYHIRLVVADVGDNFYDSAVFLAAESFNLGSEVEISAATGSNPGRPSLEGCRDAYFVFERSTGSNLQYPLTVNYQASALGAALPGADYLPMPGSVTIPAGMASIEVPVEILNDGLPEPLEDIILELDIPCACFTDTARMYIADSPPVLVRLDDFGICENGGAEISPAVQGGTPPYSYEWNTGAAASAINVTANGPPVYSVTVYDACGNSAADSASFVTTHPPEAFLSGAAAICEGDTAFLPVQFTGLPPWQVVFSIDGSPQPPVAGIFDAGYQLPATQGGAYELLEVSDAACDGYAAGQATVDIQRISLEVDSRGVSCTGFSDGGIRVEITGGIPPFQHSWLENIGPGLAPEGLPAGAFHLSVNDAAGCHKEIVIEVGSPPLLEAVKPDCALLAEGQALLSASGGTPPYLYATDGGPFYDASYLSGLTPGQAYRLTVQDAAGCLLEHDFIMPFTYGQMVELPEEIEVHLGAPARLSPRLQIPLALVDNIRWTPGLYLSCTDCLEPEILPQEGLTYTLRIADIFGCTAEATVRVRVNDEAAIFMPTAFSPNGDHINEHFTVYANTFQVERILSFKVFDRWGGLAFHKENFPPNDESGGWDGAVKGQPANAGVYAYMVEVELTNGGRQLVKGHVVLMR